MRPMPSFLNKIATGDGQAHMTPARIIETQAPASGRFHYWELLPFPPILATWPKAGTSFSGSSYTTSSKIQEFLGTYNEVRGEHETDLER